MEIKYLLDSNTIIDYFAELHSAKALSFLDNIIVSEINVSIITKIEVLSFNTENEDSYNQLLDFFDSSNVFELNTVVVNQTIKIRQENKIKLPDAVIAATALCNDCTLITNNTKDFKNITGLKLINPYEL